MIRNGNRDRMNRLMCGAAALAMAAGVGQAHAQAPTPSTQTARATQAAAQAAAAESGADAREVEEVVVTGTAIRGIAPIGANVQSVGTQEIQRIGAQSTNQILANIPVISSQFNTTANTPTSIFLSVFRPNIRNISSSGGNTTLVLVDGHNQVGVGTLQTTPDAGMIPAGALERVEVLADGGSALYGADAVGGIVNYITRSRFDGFEASGHYGTAKGGYSAYDINLTAGNSWSSGAAMIAFTNRGNTPLYSIKRERPRQDLRAFGGTDFRGRACEPGNVTAAGVTYTLPNFVPGTNFCDTTALGNIAPEEHLYSLFTSVTQDITDNLKFEMKGIISDRVTKSRSAQLTGTNAVINTTNPFFRPVGAATSQTVNFSFAPFLGLRQVARNEIKQWTITPQLTWDVGGDWQIRALYNKGWSQTDTSAPSLAPNFASLLAGPGLTTATAINPYNLLATNRQVLAQVTGSHHLIGFAEQKLDDLRAQGDGPLFEMPGGTARAAVGAEWQRSSTNAFQGTPATSVSDPTIGRGRASRKVYALFGQLNFPIIGEGNALPLVQSFTIDLSARYDHYSDFGATTNPKVAFTWEVANGLELRGNWGTAFNAPSLADTTGGADARLQYFPTTGALPPGATAGVEGQRPTITISGGNPNLQPQKAHTYSFGFDYTPTILDNLQVSASYWSVSLKDTIGLAPANNTLFSIPGYANYYKLNPTLADLQAPGVLPLQAFPTTNLAALYGIGADPYLLIDLRRGNFGTFKAKGIDFRAAYRQPMPWGDVFASISGTRALKRKQQPVVGAVVSDLLAANLSKLSLSTTLGVTVGNFTASATQNRSQGYDITNVVGQTHVKSFAPVNLAFAYNFEDGPSFTNDLTVTLNIDNVFNKNPPFINTTGGTANGSTLGRYANLGVRKRF